jgi:hypothetical protein
MCKRLTAETMWTKKGELGKKDIIEYKRIDNIPDLRVHADMFPTTPEKIYKACLVGVRRQKY